jgi:N-acylneuraminate cytidylyltransferase
MKNIKEFCGKPLVYWTLRALQKCRKIDRIFVATDSCEIKQTVNDLEFPKVEVYDREEKNATDTASTESVILEFLNKKSFADSDNFVLVQATSPLTETQDFEQAIDQYNLEKADSLLACARVKKFIWGDDKKPINYDYKNRPRRQDFKGVLMETGAFYINKVGNIKKHKNRLCGQISIFEMPEFKNVDIDTKDDWDFAERLMKKYIL